LEYTTNGGQDEVQRRVTADNRCFGILQPLFKFKILSKKFFKNYNVYSILIRPDALNPCETWPLTKYLNRKKLR